MKLMVPVIVTFVSGSYNSEMSIEEFEDYKNISTFQAKCEYLSKYFVWDYLDKKYLDVDFNCESIDTIRVIREDGRICYECK